MNKALLKKILRNLGIIKISDTLRYHIMKIRNIKDNASFKKEFPEVAIPPDYLLYEAHQLKYRAYISNGEKNAMYLKELFENHTTLEHKKVLDWGCGPARIVRHFPELLPNAEFYGTDYNKKSIAWNKKHIDKISFVSNDINPPTVFESNMFDAIYGLSIFTHLSEKNHVNWISELYRIANTNAVIIVTTHGKAYREKLIKSDQIKFDSNRLVVEGNTLEGHRTYAAYHPPKLMRQLFETKFQVLDHISGRKESWGISQDQWILRKS